MASSASSTLLLGFNFITCGLIFINKMKPTFFISLIFLLPGKDTSTQSLYKTSLYGIHILSTLPDFFKNEFHDTYLQNLHSLCHITNTSTSHIEQFRSLFKMLKEKNPYKRTKLLHIVCTEVVSIIFIHSIQDKTSCRLFIYMKKEK